MLTRTVLVGGMLLALATAAAFALQETPKAPPSKLRELEWLAGAWELRTADGSVEEHWTDAKGGLMLGAGRTLRGDKAVFFEFLRLEEREHGVYYVAHPAGRAPGTDFMLTTSSADSWTFENPDHDFPRLIRYTRGADGTFTARLEGVEKDLPVEQTLHFRRRAK